MKAKKLDSDEVGAVMWLTDRGRCEAGHGVGKKSQLFSLSFVTKQDSKC